MVKFHESSFAHDYPFPTVTLAYFLRYPNPLATHVLSTDVIEQHFDADTSRLYTARLHLKRSKIPTAVLKLLPRSWLGKDAETGTSQSYILERSIVDMKEGVMITESRNLEFTGILAVLERQMYRRPDVDLQSFWSRDVAPFRKGFNLMPPDVVNKLRRKPELLAAETRTADSYTQVSTLVELYSKLGEKKFYSRASKAPAKDGEAEEQRPQKAGFFRTWGMGSIQRSIEAIGLRRTERAVPNSKRGMNIVLERLGSGGLGAVFEGMRRDRELAVAGAGGTSRVAEED